MSYIDFMSPLHKASKRDYLSRVNDKEYPKPLAAELAKKWGYDYWDGDRRINYGGYRYIEGRWEKVAKLMIEHYDLKPGDRVLDIGCGKGFLLYDLSKLLPGLDVYGIDISEYAVINAKEEIKPKLQISNSTSLPFPNNYFDFVFSINTFHNLHNFDLELSLREMNRVSKSIKQYICVESYDNETQKANLLYWQVTCEQFCTPKEWKWWFDFTDYKGDFSFIFFD
jgi:SAM-dependent methyltransferase